ncbi:MAG: tetratricopeptide repeat protein [Bacteroidales bacterium]|nr:tetratricopeptide repeat protein [Bacteroidales bacterium]
MKARLSIFVLALMVALAACDTTTLKARRMVRQAERLADTLPDSTICLIDSVLHMAANFSERERMDMALLQAEALFGDRGQEITPVMDDDFFDDRPTLSTSPELERAAAYYAKKKKYAKAARAALYSGFVQQHYDKKEAAMHSFKEAEQYGEIAGDSLTVARAEYKMGKILYDDGMEQESLQVLKIAELGFERHFAEKALAENLIAICYMLQGNYDSSEICLHQSLLNAEKASCNNKVKGKSLNNYAVLFRLQGKNEQALDCLRQAKDETNRSKLFLNYLNMGKVFAASGQWDSAYFYYQWIEHNLPIADVKNETKASAYAALSQFAEFQDNDSLALMYHKTQEHLLYKVMLQHQEQSIYRIQQQYDYESLQNMSNRKIILRHRIILVISLLLFAASVVILFLQYKRKQLMVAEAEMKMQFEAMKQDLRQTVKSSVMDEEIALRLRMMLMAQRTAQRVKDPKKEWQALVSQVMNGKDSLFDAARATIETAYPNLYALIRERHPQLTETEAKVCLLSFSDLSNAEIAELLGLKPNTVNQNRSTLRKKLNLKPDKMKEQLRNTLANQTQF